MTGMRYTKVGTARSNLCASVVGLVALVCLVTLTGAMAVAQDESLDALAKAGHWKRVRQAVQQRSSQPWNEADKAYWQARVKQAFGDLDGSETLARKAVSLDGSNAAYYRQLASVPLGPMASRSG